MKASVVINIPELAERLDNDFELFLKLLELFTDDSEFLILSIEDAIKNRDHEALRKAAHTLKGAVANFSAPAAYKAVSILEKTGKDVELTGAKDQLLKLKSEIESVLKEMKRISEKGSF